MSDQDNLLRNLPSIDRLLKHDLAQPLIEDYTHQLTVEALRSAIDQTRAQLISGTSALFSPEDIITDAGKRLEEWFTPTLRHVINATGVVLHTNLGRAPLSDAAIHAVKDAASGYSTLEYDLESGKRGSRSIHAEDLLKRLTGAEAALVVNNNAAAVLLALSALAGRTMESPDGQGVIVSRGQLVEIGGGFRIPDVMRQSGAKLIEVGATNRTHLYDYQNAITDETALLLRVHRSNFKLIGFTTEPGLAELSTLAKDHHLLMVDDLGSGALSDTSAYGLSPEPTVRESLEAGADLAMFSGDKLLGGPQAGILVGRKDVIEQLKRHPLARAVRADKLCLAALSATLTHYLRDEASEHIPIWQMISTPLDTLTRRAQDWADRLSRPGFRPEITAGKSAIGGGSLPGETLPTALLALPFTAVEDYAARLRTSNPPIIARIEDDRLLIDPRTVLPREEERLLSILESLVD